MVFIILAAAHLFACVMERKERIADKEIATSEKADLQRVASMLLRVKILHLSREKEKTEKRRRDGRSNFVNTKKYL